MKEYYGLYKAKCLDTADPLGLGRILVHIYMRDGALTYDEASHGWCPVLSPYGGNQQMGLFMMPPINADGYVIFEGGEPTKPVWVGSYPLPPKVELDEGATESANAPIFKITPTIPPEAGDDPTKVVWKTQYTTSLDMEIDSDENVVENLIVMDETKLEFNHINKNGYEYNKGGVTADQAKSYIKLEDASVTIGVKGTDGRSQEIQIGIDGIKIISSTGEYISVVDGVINIIGGEESKINIGGLCPVEISCTKFLVDGESIIVGPPGENGGGGVITADCICPFTGLPTHIGSSKTLVGG